MLWFLRRVSLGFRYILNNGSIAGIILPRWLFWKSLVLQIFNAQITPWMSCAVFTYLVSNKHMPHPTNNYSGDFPGVPVVDFTSNSGGQSSIPGWGAKIPHALGPKNRSNIVTNSIKTLKMVHIKKKIFRTSQWSSGYDSILSMQGVWVQSLVRELDPTCRNEDWRSCIATTKTQHSQVIFFILKKFFKSLCAVLPLFCREETEAE